MNLNPNDTEAVKTFIEQFENEFVDGHNDIYTFEAYDREANCPCIITYYKTANPIKLSMKMHINGENEPRIAAFNENGERIEDETNPY